MKNFSERFPGCIASGPADKILSEKDFWQLALEAVKARRGLIHGHLNKHGRVCAVGAVFSRTEEAVSRVQVESLQTFNDSMPRAKPGTRRNRVLAWIEKRIADSASESQ